eukprot:5979603-Amphidinium_carterae.1
MPLTYASAFNSPPRKEQDGNCCAGKDIPTRKDDVTIGRWPSFERHCRALRAWWRVNMTIASPAGRKVSGEIELSVPIHCPRSLDTPQRCT